MLLCFAEYSASEPAVRNGGRLEVDGGHDLGLRKSPQGRGGQVLLVELFGAASYDLRAIQCVLLVCS